MELTNEKYGILAGISLTVGALVVILANNGKKGGIMKINQTSKRGVNLIKQFEGLRLTAYQCSAGVWTVGYGHTTGVKQGQTISESQAEMYLKSDVGIVDSQLEKLNLPLNQNQFDALASFVFNVGFTKFNTSTLLKKIKANPADKSIDAEFRRWVNSGGKVSAGLQKRRDAEAKLYFS